MEQRDIIIRGNTGDNKDIITAAITSAIHGEEQLEENCLIKIYIETVPLPNIIIEELKPEWTEEEEEILNRIKY